MRAHPQIKGGGCGGTYCSTKSDMSFLKTIEKKKKDGDTPSTPSSGRVIRGGKRARAEDVSF